MLILRAYPRIHIGLIDLGSATHRRYGGIGFSLSEPATVVRATPSRRLSVIGLRKLDSAGRRDVLAALDRLKQRIGHVTLRLTIERIPPQHVGLGTKTTIVLALLAAATRLLKVPMTTGCIQRLSGRGGASGVGINSFFLGGMIADAGRDPASVRAFRPSSAHSGHTPPPVVSRAAVPSSWRIYLLLPRGRRYTGGDEVRFFASNTPIPRTEILSTLALVYHGIVPAFLAADLHLLRRVLAQLHRTGFKRRELVGQPRTVRALYDALSRIPSVAVGLSSIGPLLYVIALERDTHVARRVTSLSRRFSAPILGVAKGRNRGFSVWNR